MKKRKLVPIISILALLCTVAASASVITIFKEKNAFQQAAENGDTAQVEQMEDFRYTGIEPDNDPAPAQFEVMAGTPYCVKEGALYRYEETGWTDAGHPEPIRQLLSGERLCVIDAQGSVISEADLSLEGAVPLTTGYHTEMARQLMELNQTTPFVELSGTVMDGPKALLEDGTLLLLKLDHYEKYSMDERPVALSGSYILTEEGNVYCQTNPQSEETQVRCIYEGGDIAAISSSPSTGECIGLTTRGTVLTWISPGDNFFEPLPVTEWENVVSVRQGHRFAIALTKTGEVLYVDHGKESTERIGKALAEWKNITNIAVYGMGIYGLASDGDCLSLKVEFD